MDRNRSPYNRCSSRRLIRTWRAVMRRSPAKSQPRERATKSGSAPDETSRDSSTTRSNDTAPSPSSRARAGWSMSRRAVSTSRWAVSAVKSMRDAAHSGRLRAPSIMGTWAKSRAWRVATWRARSCAMWDSSLTSSCSSWSMVVSTVLIHQTYRPGRTKRRLGSAVHCQGKVGSSPPEAAPFSAVPKSCRPAVHHFQLLEGLTSSFDALGSYLGSRSNSSVRVQ